MPFPDFSRSSVLFTEKEQFLSRTPHRLSLTPEVKSKNRGYLNYKPSGSWKVTFKSYVIIWCLRCSVFFQAQLSRINSESMFSFRKNCFRGVPLTAVFAAKSASNFRRKQISWRSNDLRSNSQTTTHLSAWLGSFFKWIHQNQISDWGLKTPKDTNLKRLIFCRFHLKYGDVIHRKIVYSFPVLNRSIHLSHDHWKGVPSRD